MGVFGGCAITGLLYVIRNSWIVQYLVWYINSVLTYWRKFFLYHKIYTKNWRIFSVKRIILRIRNKAWDKPSNREQVKNSSSYGHIPQSWEYLRAIHNNLFASFNNFLVKLSNYLSMLLCPSWGLYWCIEGIGLISAGLTCYLSQVKISIKKCNISSIHYQI